MLLYIMHMNVYSMMIIINNAVYLCSMKIITTVQTIHWWRWIGALRPQHRGNSPPTAANISLSPYHPLCLYVHVFYKIRHKCNLWEIRSIPKFLNKFLTINKARMILSSCLKPSMIAMPNVTMTKKSSINDQTELFFTISSRNRKFCMSPLQ